MAVPSLSSLCMNVVARTENFIQLNGDAMRDLPVEVLRDLLAIVVRTVQTKSASHVIPLKIRLMKQNRLVTSRFLLHGSISQTVSEIFEKNGIADGSGEKEDSYGLFQTAGAFHGNRWLRDDRTLSFYGLKPGDVLEFKPKKGMIKVHFWGPWSTLKTLLVDESRTVAELTNEMGPKLGFSAIEEFSLQVAKEENGCTNYVWLNPHEPLTEQGIDPRSTTLLFRKKEFYRKLGELDDEESLTRELCQCIDVVVNGMNPCTREEAILFAALQCQIRFGECLTNADALSDFSWSEYFPSEYIVRNIERDVLPEYKRLGGMSSTNAKYRYILHARSLKTYGFTFFKLERLLNGQSSPVLFGVSKDMTMLLDPESKDTLSLCSLYHISQWQVLNDTLRIVYSDHVEEFIAPDPTVISQVIADYLYFTYTHKRTIKKRKSQGPEDDDVASQSYSHSQFRPGSPPTSLTLKEREMITKKLQIKSSSWEGFSNIPVHPNPHLKKSPIYLDPFKIHLSPLYGHPLEIHKVDHANEKNYLLRVIRSLSCLSSSSARKEGQFEIRVKFPDLSIRNFPINESMTVTDIAMDLAEKIGIRNPEEFSLQLSESNVWLNPYQTLKSQLPNENTVLHFKKKFFYHDAFVNNTDPVYFNLLFCQLHHAIVSGLYVCTLSEAVQLAATKFQINFGDHNPAIHKPGFLKQTDLKHFLPESLESWGITFQKLEKQIYKEHCKLRGIKEEFAKYRYLQLCRNLKSYGTVLFPVKLVSQKGKNCKLPSEVILLGFSRDSILFMTNNKLKDVLQEFPLVQLRKWEGTASSFMLDFGDYEQGQFWFEAEGDIISKYLSDYFDFIQRNFMATQTFNNELCKYPPQPEVKYLLSDHHCCWENGKRVFTSTFVDC
eukprot:TRINITY_DN4169_c0_g1_i1.p1 TRINITY_DN4169_c0_g1~~TRINITY_DN4169_c0_g1_i1.p1  ORF type:complete len:889 (-),score=215.13 TRINITY_DN4169_c0_g1_i1:222-2888(-)